MSQRIAVAGLSVEKTLHDVLVREIIPGTGLEGEAFFRALASIVAALGPENRSLLAKRDAMQVRCADNASAERLLRPDAREELILTLSSKVAEDLLTNAGKMVLRKDLIALFGKYAGEGKVQDLYFTEFVFQ